MRKTLIVLAVIIAGVILLVSPKLLSVARIERIRSFVLNSDRIDLQFVTQRKPESKDAPGVTLTEEAGIRAFVGELRLEPKEPCSCGPHDTIRFWRDTKYIDVSVCDHCFNVIDDKGRLQTCLKMPETLWKRFSEFKKRSGKAERQVS